VVYKDEPAHLEGRRGNPGDEYSIGLQVNGEGMVTDSIVGGPAFKAGISSGMKVAGVNGRLFREDLLKDAIKAAKDSSRTISLLVVVDDYYRTCNIDYHGGLRYPHLERLEAKPDYLDDLIKARAAEK